MRVYACVCACVCVCVSQVHNGEHRGQKERQMSEPLELESQVGVTHLSPLQKQQPLLTAGPSLG